MVAGSACILLAFLYSWRPVRLKAIPLVDLFSHAAMLAGLQFLAAYLTFAGGTGSHWIYPALMVLAFSLYGQLFNELRDLEGDLQAGVTHTASYLGRTAAYWLMMGWLAIGICAAIMTQVVEQLVPGWVLLLMFALAGLLVLLRVAWKGRGSSTIKLHQAFQKPAEIAAAIALAVWFASPWLVALD